MVTSSWKAQEEGLAGFVSHTAIIVAATRLAEAKHKQPILVDPLLEAMLRSSPGVEKAVKEFKEQTDAQEKEDGVDHVAAFTSVRMRYGDEQLLRLLPSGHAQVVILGSGLDTRSWRLALDQCDVYEVDQPDMVQMKRKALVAAGAQLEKGVSSGSHAFPLNALSWSQVPADLCGTWSQALLDAGFQKGLPTVWIAEGLLYYIDHEAMHRILEAMAAMSAPISSMIVTHLSQAYFRAVRLALEEREDTIEPDAREFYESWKSGMPENISGFLESAGWQIERSATMNEVHKMYGVHMVRGMESAEMKRRYESKFGPLDYCLVTAIPLTADHARADEAAAS